MRASAVTLTRRAPTWSRRRAGGWTHRGVHVHAAVARRGGRVWHEGAAVTELAGAGAPADYDVVVAGAGVVGSALAAELSQHKLRVLLLDAKHDVGEGTSKANAAIVHTGFDATPSTLESELVVEASHEWPAMAARLQIPFRECGAILLARDAEQAAALPGLYEKAVENFGAWPSRPGRWPQMLLLGGCCGPPTALAGGGGAVDMA